MIELEDADILYLDNDRKHLNDTRKQFEAQGLKLQTTLNPVEAQQKAVASKVNIFLCDLRMEPVTAERGIDILKNVRSRNNQVFLAILSAYTGDFGAIERQLMDNIHIKVYTKHDINNLLLNLGADFTAFQTEKIKTTIPSDLDLVQTMKRQVIASLKGISNQQLLLPVKGYDRYSIDKLIKEIENATGVGQVFVNDWMEAIGKMKNL